MAESSLHAPYRDGGGAIVKARAFHLWDSEFNSHYGHMITCVKRDSQRSAESRGVFTGFSGFLPHRMFTEWDRIALNWD